MWKLLKEGDRCRHCNTPTIQVNSKKSIKATQSYYFKSYLFCPRCKEIYLLESEKVFIKKLSLF